MRRPLAPLALSLLLAVPVTAQLARGGAPASFGAGLPGEVPTVFLEPPDVAAMRAEDEARGPFPLRYGAVMTTDVALARTGRWDEVGDSLVWRVAVASPGAYTLGLVFGEASLPEGAQLFAYDAERRLVLGAFGRETFLADGTLPLQPIPGSEVVVELVLPAATLETPALAVTSVVHDYRDVMRLKAPSASQSRTPCLVDINCPAGAPYQDIKRAVVGLYRGGFVCSGSILNNAREDERPFMLTANHCGGMTNAVVVFDYELSGCSSGSSSNSKSIAGATLLAADSTVDSQLYELSSSPPRSYAPYYAGWSRSLSPTGPAISISHPAGLPKKIAIDHAGPQPWGTEQFAASWDVGMIQGGSSGSPLFSGSGRVIGPACCVTNFTCGMQMAYYGKFNRFYKRKNLGQWLDPDGSTNGAIDGYDPFAPLSVAYNGSGTNPDVFTSTPPELGTTWTGTVDTSAFPSATSTVLLGYDGADSGTFLTAGELLLDLGSTFLFRSGAGVVGSSSVHTAMLPADPMLEGRVAFTQAVILGGGAQLTNALELTLN